MLRSLLCCVLLLVLASVALAQAQATPATPDLSAPLTLEQCLQLALQAHPTVVSAQFAVNRAAAQAAGQRALLYPAFTAEWSAQESKSLDRPGSSLSGGRYTTRDADLAASYTLYRSGRSEQIRRYGLLSEASAFALEDARRQLRYQVRNAYFTVLAARQNLSVTGRALANSERHRDQVQARITAGTAPASDLLPIQVEVSNARLDAVKAETTLDVAYAVLRSLLVLPAESRFDLADALPQHVAPADLSLYLSQADRSRPDLAQSRLDVRAANLGRRVTEAENGLSLSAVASGDYGRHTGVDGEQWTLAVGASYPVFDGGASRSNIRAARADEGISQQQLVSTQLQVQQEVESAWSRLKQAGTSLEAATLSRRNAEQSLAASEARYLEGLAIIIEVTNAQVALSQAELAEVQARYDAAVALAALNQATGTDAVPDAPLGK